MELIQSPTGQRVIRIKRGEKAPEHRLKAIFEAPLEPEVEEVSKPMRRRRAEKGAAPRPISRRAEEIALLADVERRIARPCPRQVVAGGSSTSSTAHPRGRRCL